MNEAQKTYRVIIRDSAKQDMTEHIAFLANVSVSAAKRLRVNIIKKMKSLAKNPHRCPVYDTPYCSGVYRKLLVYPYLVLFVIEENTVSIEYVADGRKLNLFPTAEK